MNETALPGVSEDALIGLRRGEEKSFEELIEQFEAPVLRFLLSSHGNPVRAREQCVETFTRLVSAFPRMREAPTSIRGFVFGVARNVLREYWRSEAETRGDPLEAALKLPGDSPSPLELLVQRAEVQRALSLLSALESPAREIAYLRFFEMMSIGEIASALRMPTGTVKSHIHRIREILWARMRSNRTFRLSHNEAPDASRSCANKGRQP